MLETFGRYQLVEKLATGGMGQVYLARQKGPVGFEKLLVVKRILPHLSEEEDFIDMFFDEARIAAVLNHPNIAQIFDLGEVEGTYFIAMEYVHGVSVRDLTGLQKVPLALKCRILADAAAGLDYAHRAQNAAGQALGLIHRDVSPQNILVGFNGGVKVIDFGVAKAAGKISTTMTGAIKGKYAYMSPEQARGDSLDNRSDIFGLGIVFYEFLTEERLFKRPNETATLKAVVGDKIPPPSTLVKSIPKALDAVVMKALARKRSERFQTAGELQLAIEEVLIKQRLPATSTHLAHFLRDLYPQASRPRQTDVAMPALVTAEVSRSAGKSARGKEVVRPGKDKEASTGNSAEGMSGGELERSLARLGPDHKVAGLFINAVLNAVAQRCGPEGEAVVRGAKGQDRLYQDDALYPATEFFSILWKAARRLLPLEHGRQGAFRALGEACGDKLIQAPAARPLRPLAVAGDAAAAIKAFLVVLKTSLPPGEREVAAAKKGLTVTFRDDPYPLPFWDGLLSGLLFILKGLKPQATLDEDKTKSTLTLKF